MLKGLKKFFLKMMAGANIVTVIIMLLVGMAGRLSPAEHPMLTNAGLLYPVFLLINLAFMIFWLTFHWKGVLIPIVGYLLCYGSLRVYLPLNMPADAPDDAIKVMTYNVCRFAKGSIRDDGTNPVIEYIKQSGADIVCLQEASSDIISQKDISRELSKVYEYGDTVVRHYSGNTIAIYSKYPIVGKERIEFDSKWNISAAFKVLIDGDTVMVVNNHLETNKLRGQHLAPAHQPPGRGCRYPPARGPGSGRLYPHARGYAHDRVRRLQRQPPVVCPAGGGQRSD